MAVAVRSLHPVAHGRAASPVAEERVAVATRVARREPESKLWKKLQAGEFAVSVEIDPPKGISLDRIFEQVDKIRASGRVDAIDINSGTMARVGMDALITAGAL